MLFEGRFWPGIADGSITTTFRRWKRPQAVAGRPYRTGGGIIDVACVDTVAAEDISDDEARAAGYPSAAALLADLRGGDELPITRIVFRRSTTPDPRAVLAADDALDDDAVAAITARLERLDRASSIGPWTRRYLRLVAAHPEVRAADLADAEGRNLQPFKLDVRKLKNLGLTLSFPVGYRLSPRGLAYLNRRQSGVTGSAQPGDDEGGRAPIRRVGDETEAQPIRLRRSAQPERLGRLDLDLDVDAGR